LHELVFFSLLILTFIRLVGLGVSIDLFMESKHSRYKTLTLGWTLWVITGIIPILSDNLVDVNFSEILLVLNSIFLVVGFLLVTIGIISHFREIPAIASIALTCFIALPPILLYYVDGFDSAISFSSLGFLSVAILLVYSAWLDRKNLRMLLGNSIKWFFGIIIFGFIYLINGALTVLEGYSFGLYQSNNVFMIVRYYFFAIGITLLITILIIHLEQSISYLQKFQLRDIYSHDLGNIMQIILNNIEAIDSIDEKNQPNADLIKMKCIEAGDLIKEIRER